MPDIRERLAVFDTEEPPEGLRGAIEGRLPAPMPVDPSRARRAVVAAVALAIAAASLAFTAHAFHEQTAGSSPPPPRNGLLAIAGADHTTWLVNPDDSQATPIERPAGVSDLTPTSWSPNGSQLLLDGVHSDMQGGGGEGLFVVNADGSGLRDLSVSLELPPADVQYLPHWSPDGSMIEFENDSDAPSRTGVYVMRSDGSGMRKIATGGYAAWAPDGSRLVFQGGDGIKRAELYTVGPDGSDLRLLAVSPRPLNQSPSWSPDGSRILFEVGNYHATREDLYVVGAEGGQPMRITEFSNVFIGNPTWSPDGREILFSLTDGDLPNYGPSDLVVINANGSGFRRLTNTPTWEEGPVWSPDGTSIAFARSGPSDYFPEYERWDLVTIQVDGTDPRVLIQKQLVGRILTWQPLPPASPTP